VGQIVTTRLRPSAGGTGSNDSLEAICEWDRQSRLAQGQPPARQVVTTRPRPSSGGRHNHDSSEAKPKQDRQSRLIRGQARVVDVVTTHPRPSSGSRRSHDSPKATLAELSAPGLLHLFPPLALTRHVPHVVASIHLTPSNLPPDAIRGPTHPTPRPPSLPPNVTSLACRPDA
jgi:hypothetical protein